MLQQKAQPVHEYKIHFIWSPEKVIDDAVKDYRKGLQTCVSAKNI